MPLLPRPVLASIRRIRHGRDLTIRPSEARKALVSECQAVGVPKSGSKRVLSELLIQHGIASSAATVVQRHVRGRSARSRMRGLGALVPLSSCVNDTDFFTMEPVASQPRDQLYVHTAEDGKHYAFTWSSLRLLIESEDPLRNPYTREIMPSAVKALARTAPVHPKKRGVAPPREKRLELRAIDAFHAIDMLGFFTDHMWLWSLNARAITRWATVVSELWRYRLLLSDEAKSSIFPPHARGVSPSFARSRGRNLDDVRAGALTVIEQLTDAADDVVHKRQGALIALIALCAVSADAARAMPVMADVI